MKRTLRAACLASGALGLVIACSTETPDDDTGTGGSGATPTVGGSTGTGATAGHATGGTGGSTGGTGGGTGATGGSTGATGGTAAGTGGTAAGTGGTAAGTGGSASGAGGSASGAGGTAAGTGGSAGQPGSGGAPAGGMSGAGPMGGRPGSGGMSGGAGTGQGGSGAGSGGSAGGGSCQKGTTKGSDVVIMGESFYAIAPQYIQNRIQDNARKAGSLGANETYRNVAVSGQNMNYIATTEWTAATQGGATVKWVIMDGGGIDCLTGGSNCTSCAGTFKTLLGKMATAGVTDVIYTRYPEPGAPPGSNASLKACLDATMPSMQTTCEGSTAPRCHWVDLRPVWKDGDTTDGLHPTQSGGEHVGDLIWSEMVKLCFAQ